MEMLELKAFRPQLLVWASREGISASWWVRPSLCVEAWCGAHAAGQEIQPGRADRAAVSMYTLLGGGLHASIWCGSEIILSSSFRLGGSIPAQDSAAVWPWAYYSTFVGTGVLTCKMDIL